MKRTKYLLLAVIFSSYSHGQEIAIFDQGFNTTMNNRGHFYSPRCYGIEETWVGTRNGFYQGAFTPSGITQTPLDEGNWVSILDVNLCSNQLNGAINANSSLVPRSRSFPSINRFGQPYLGVAMWAPISSFHQFPLPFQTRLFGSNLTHGSHVSNAATEFDNSVRKKMVQIFHIGRVPANPQDCTPTFTPEGRITPNTGVIGGTRKIIEAMNDIIENPEGVDAINMSLGFRSSFCQRRSGNFVPPICDPVSPVGQNQVNTLKRLGIAVVAGLENVDIGAQEVTWPACLDGVIKVGSENDNNNVANGGIGIGANGIDFYARNTNVDGAVGNSMASPRIATAYALLAEAVPSSTVDQRTQALKLASTRMNVYRSNGTNYTRRYVRNTDIPQAVIELQKLIQGNLENIFFEDLNQYGSIYADNSTSYSFEIDFNDLIGSDPSVDARSLQTNGEVITPEALTTQVSTVSSVRDVVIKFDGRMNTGAFQAITSLDIRINNTLVQNTGSFRGDKSFEYVISRNQFSQGSNTISIRPRSSNVPWGISNINAEFTPAVRLIIGQTDQQEYGYLQDPSRFTGLRTYFDIGNTQSDYIFTATGWDIDTPDENQVFLNDSSLGFLTQGEGSSQYSPPNTFLLRRSSLEDGNNVVEFVQRSPGGTWTGFEFEKWAVRDISIKRAFSDLVIRSVRIVDNKLTSTQPFVVMASFHNAGIGSTVSGFDVRFFASQDKTISTNDIPLTSVTTSRLNENNTRSITTSIQTSLVNQGYYLGVCVTSVQSEAVTNNNCSSGTKLKDKFIIAPILNILLGD